MSNRIDEKFKALHQAGRKAFIAYITAGDPNLDQTRRIALQLEGAGVDILELGVPFSDPLADGAVNQAAAQRALSAGTTVSGLLQMIRSLREVSQLPIVLFTYLNPIYIYGYEKFHEDAAAAGVDGILILDLPPDEAAVNRELASAAGLKTIRLIAPTTPASRVASLARVAEGFIYYVSREGVTGEQATLSEGIGAQVEAIKSHSQVPVAVGFGISTPDQAAEVARAADGVIVGSAIVRRIAEMGDAPDLAEKIADFARPLAEATHAISS